MELLGTNAHLDLSFLFINHPGLYTFFFPRTIGPSVGILLCPSHMVP